MRRYYQDTVRESTADYFVTGTMEEFDPSTVSETELETLLQDAEILERDVALQEAILMDEEGDPDLARDIRLGR